MSNEIMTPSKNETLAAKCVNKKLMDSFIQSFQDSTKSAVENILNWHSPNFVDTLHNAFWRFSNSIGLNCLRCL